jgi:heterotetrameric sarcosine oxidase delta subunit
MLLITCPWCGPRDQTEFTYGGDANVKRPANPDALTDEAWANYVYIRDNPRGAHAELWHHHASCRRWLKVRRNTITHEILATAKLDEELPAGT